MKKTCSSCRREKSFAEFGINRANETGRNTTCKECRRKKANAVKRAEIEVEVRRLYEGRCVICDTPNDLEVISTLETQTSNPNAMVLICSNCKKLGKPIMSRFKRDCMRCEHSWIARKSVTITCPNCGSPYWHIPKRGGKK